MLSRRQLLGLGHVALSTTNRQERWRDQRFIHSLSPAGHYRLRDAAESRWEEFVAPDGTLAIPGRALGVVAEA